MGLQGELHPVWDIHELQLWLTDVKAERSKNRTQISFTSPCWLLFALSVTRECIPDCHQCSLAPADTFLGTSRACPSLFFFPRYHICPSVASSVFWMYIEKRFLQEKNLMNSCCEVLLKLKIMPNTGIRAPPLALFLKKMFSLNTVFLHQLMIINGLPVAIPPPVEFHFSNPPTSSRNRSTQLQQLRGGKKGSKAGYEQPCCAWNQNRGVQEHQGALPSSNTDPDCSCKNWPWKAALVEHFQAGQVCGTALSCLMADFHSKHQHCSASLQKSRESPSSKLQCSPGFWSWVLPVTQE